MAISDVKTGFSFPNRPLVCHVVQYGKLSGHFVAAKVEIRLIEKKSLINSIHRINFFIEMPLFCGGSS